MGNFDDLRQQMVEYQLAARGLHNKAVLDAVNNVSREEFVPTDLVEFAYQDTPLPIAASQTISQPYIVALMTAALELTSDDRVLEVGTGSGYAAAVLAEIAAQVYTIERHKILADSARNRLIQLGYKNTYVLHGDGTLGWPEHAPFDAIVVAAGGPEVPQQLKEQLAIGGRLVIPVGTSVRSQHLVKVIRVSENEYIEEDLGGVRFVPLIGAAGWEDETAEKVSEPASKETARLDAAKLEAATLPELIYESSEHFSDIDSANLDGLLDRIGDSRLVLLGESSHGTREFYDMRARISKELIEKKGFKIIAVEADWPDAASIDHFVRGSGHDPMFESKPFTRFPTWMWANHSVSDFTHWLKNYNQQFNTVDDAVGFYGLDLYSMHSSMEAVLNYLQGVDPETAEIARVRYGCLMPWANDPSLYSRVALSSQYSECEFEVLAVLQDLLKKRLDYTPAGWPSIF